MIVSIHKFNMLLNSAILLFICGFVLSVLYYKKYWKFNKKATGKIIKYIELKQDEFSIYMPVVQFKDFKDRLVEAIITQKKSLEPKLQINTELAIRYNPIFPEMVVMEPKYRKIIANNFFISSIILITITFIYKNMMGI